MSKTCTKCEIEKNLSEFYKRKDSKDGYRNDCKKCNNQQSHQYYIDNAEHLKICKKQYNIDNAEHLKMCRKQYVIDNAEQIRKYRNIYDKERKLNDLNFKKSYNLSRLLNQCLKNKTKISKLENYIGCKLNFLYKWLAYTAGEDFDWSKYGKIYEVDHCIAKSFYDHENEQQIKQCWSWKNLRLITKKENNSKGSKLDLDIRYENASLAEDFLDEYDF